VGLRKTRPIGSTSDTENLRYQDRRRLVRFIDGIEFRRRRS
jgi:hypothetical protein